MIVLFILIYLVSLVIHLIILYKENKQDIYYVKDLLDETEFEMWCPILNTVMLIVFILFVCLMAIEKLWEKFKNIKIK